MRHACLQAKNGDYQAAVAELSRFRPPTWESLYYRGWARLELEELVERLKDFDQATKLNPNHFKYSCLYYKRAFACHLLGRYADAILNYTIYIEKNVHKGYLGRGLVYTDLVDYKNALKDIQRANDLNFPPGENFGGHFYCGATLYESKNFAAALEALEKGLHCRPNE